jgi:hypothetical protein
MMSRSTVDGLQLNASSLMKSLEVRRKATGYLQAAFGRSAGHLLASKLSNKEKNFVK